MTPLVLALALGAGPAIPPAPAEDLVPIAYRFVCKDGRVLAVQIVTDGAAGFTLAIPPDACASTAPQRAPAKPKPGT